MMNDPCTDCSSATCVSDSIKNHLAAFLSVDGVGENTGCHPSVFQNAKSGDTVTFCATLTTPMILEENFLSFLGSIPQADAGCNTSLIQNWQLTNNCMPVPAASFTTVEPNIPRFVQRPVWQVAPNTTYEMCYDVIVEGTCTQVATPCFSPHWMTAPCEILIGANGNDCSRNDGTYDLVIDFTNGGQGPGTYTLINNGGGVLGGDDPNTNLSGRILISNIPDGEGYDFELIGNGITSGCTFDITTAAYNCSFCPKIATATVSKDECVGNTVTLTATVNGGIEGQDYYIEWLVDGTPINQPGSATFGIDGVYGNADDPLTALTYEHTLNLITDPGGCSYQEQVFTAKLYCKTSELLEQGDINTVSTQQGVIANYNALNETCIGLDLTNVPDGILAENFEYQYRVTSGPPFGLSWICEAILNIKISTGIPYPLCHPFWASDCPTVPAGPSSPVSPSGPNATTCFGGLGNGPGTTLNPELGPEIENLGGVYSTTSAKGNWQVCIFDTYNDNNNSTEGVLNYLYLKVNYFLPPGVDVNFAATSIVDAVNISSPIVSPSGPLTTATHPQGPDLVTGLRVCSTPLAGIDYLLPDPSSCNSEITVVCGNGLVRYSADNGMTYPLLTPPGPYETNQEVYYQVTTEDCFSGCGGTGSYTLSNCPEICGNGIDDDNDGLIDFADQDCSTCDVVDNSRFFVWTGDGQNNLIKVNVETGVENFKANMTTASNSVYGDIGFGPNGKLYGIEFSSLDYTTSAPSIINEIDTITGNATIIGSTPFEWGNSLSFDEFGYGYVASGSNVPMISKVYRFNIYEDTYNLEEWHDFGAGRSGGDFIFLNGKMYVAWLNPFGNFEHYLYEVTLGPDNSYVSHINLGKLEGTFWGLTSDAKSKLYGAGGTDIYEITIPPAPVPNVDVKIVYTLIAPAVAFGATYTWESLGNVYLNCDIRPLAIDDINTTQINNPVSGNVLTNDEDGNNDVLMVNPTLMNPSGGTVVMDSLGNYTFTPAVDFMGEASFSYEICEVSSFGFCDTALVIIEVLDAPSDSNNQVVGVEDNFITESDQQISASLLSNDSDPDGDGLIINTIPISLPANGSLVINPDGIFDYKPDPNFSGSDIFYYEVCDDRIVAVCDTVKVNIEVLTGNGENDFYATDDANLGLIGDTLIGNLVLNDNTPSGEIFIETTPIDSPINGNVTIHSDGTYTYIPNPDFVGNDRFIYQACNDIIPRACDQATVYITILDNRTLLSLKVLLQGALLGTTDTLMRADLVAQNLVPLTQPYDSLQNPFLANRFVHKIGGDETTTNAVLNANSGTPNGIVDWVFVEFRDATDSLTIIRTRSALVQRDGDVVDAATGEALYIADLPNEFFVVVKHRNHLGVMTRNPMDVYNRRITIDFTTINSSDLYNHTNYDGLEQTMLFGKNALWAANVNVDGKVKYDGAFNDRIIVASDILQVLENSYMTLNYNNAIGYHLGDVNLDGKVKYDGFVNDRILIQLNVLEYLMNTAYLNNFDEMIEQIR